VWDIRLVLKLDQLQYDSLRLALEHRCVWCLLHHCWLFGFASLAAPQGCNYYKAEAMHVAAWRWDGCSCSHSSTVHCGDPAAHAAASHVCFMGYSGHGLSYNAVLYQSQHFLCCALWLKACGTADTCAGAYTAFMS
jgi:hypothetical protein